jgi:PAS domain S-box-containing protein
MNGKREMIRELTNSAWSILAKYENDERNGILSREEAQRTSVSRIQYLRYGEENKDYFWITDMFPTMIMHPYRQDLNGTDLTDFSDPHGKKMFVEFVNTVKASENGYVDYMWQWKDDSLTIVPKLSYVKIFKPWGWIIGTGIYIEDVKKEIRELTRKLLWISVGISVVIVFLLVFISQQSLKIEQQKTEAEKELHHSKEKYRTLVEAATEGLIMLIDGKISFSNNVISKITGYESRELLNLSLSELISENNTEDIMEAFRNNNFKEGQYEINLNNRKGGFTEVLVTSTSAIFYNKAVNIITIKDITADRGSSFSILDYQKLIGSLNIGFFRADLDSRGRFIFANETTVRILGYDNFRDLSQTNILEILVEEDDKRTLKKTLLESGYIRNRILKIWKKNNETSYIAITLVAFASGNFGELICDGTIEDVTNEETEREDRGSLIADLKSGSFLIEQSVLDYIIPVNLLDAEKTIGDALKLMSINKTDNLLLVKNEKDFIGIITSTDIQKRVLSLKLGQDNPAYMIMSSPVICINKYTSLVDAINICDEQDINHLVVKNEAGIAEGIVRINDIYKAFKNSLSFYISNARKAESNDELKKCFRVHQLLMEPLVRSEISVPHLTRITSSFSDAVIRRIIELTIQDIGKPPAGFSFICLGSEGRKEETLFTDQDNAIIFEDVSAEKESIVNDYFIKLGTKVCDSLNQVGYSFCRGNIMAKNQQWCKPLKEWEKYFRDWIATPEPQNLLEATIFFDFRNIYGDEAYTARLRKTISRLISQRSMFLYHLAYNTFSIKPQQISSGSIISEKSIGTVNLKEAVNIIIMFVRTYSLKNDIWYSNTIERLNALKEGKIISETTSDEMIFIYNYLMKLRFRNQVELAAEKMPLSNILNTQKLQGIELSGLKKVLGMIPGYQHKISVDFRIST